MENPDYLFPGFLAEAKILEEEGLRKASRQPKLAKLLEEWEHGANGEDFYDEAPSDLQRQIEDLLLKPIQGAVRKAAGQLAAARAVELFEGCGTVLIAINCGYSSIPSDLFQSLVLRSCRKDTSQIDFVACLSVHHHQGPFDSCVFFHKDAVSVHENAAWHGFNAFMSAADDLFLEAMTKMMQDQMNQSLWAVHLPPVEDIVFENNGVTYIRKAPPVLDSRNHRP